MDPEYIEERLEEETAELDGEELKEEVEAVLDEEEIDYSNRGVSGLEQPEHKQYSYELEIGEETYRLEVILVDGRPGHEDGSVNLEKKNPGR
ncbi:MAG: hypothetical protein ABEK10_02085 [Candidatus Nanosalina sp.]